ncbi:hypothetical protein HPB51_017524 [Rhipicephalus microplus]|uniref:Uncharacterized protein n=1 Tax=Rhipicephalus microplus TaxID=6941 RepID=A0A9J6F4K5_RHIMP|nr:hypothetical protein HPB51_017524 [Rhipicephalus microplus]
MTALLLALVKTGVSREEEEEGVGALIFATNEGSFVYELDWHALVGRKGEQTTFQEQCRQLIRGRIRVSRNDAAVRAQEHARVAKRKQQLRAEVPAAIRAECKRHRRAEEAASRAEQRQHGNGENARFRRMFSGALASAATSATACGRTHVFGFADADECRPALPESLETIPKADYLPTQRHRWNTNERRIAIHVDERAGALTSLGRRGSSPDENYSTLPSHRHDVEHVPGAAPLYAGPLLEHDRGWPTVLFHLHDANRKILLKGVPSHHGSLSSVHSSQQWPRREYRVTTDGWSRCESHLGPTSTRRREESSCRRNEKEKNPRRFLESALPAVVAVCLSVLRRIARPFLRSWVTGRCHDLYSSDRENSGALAAVTPSSCLSESAAL